MYPLLMETNGQPHGTAADCLIAEFLKQNDISHIYVIHDV